MKVETAVVSLILLMRGNLAALSRGLRRFPERRETEASSVR